METEKDWEAVDQGEQGPKDENEMPKKMATEGEDDEEKDDDDDKDDDEDDEDDDTPPMGV